MGNRNQQGSAIASEGQLIGAATALAGAGARYTPAEARLLARSARVDRFTVETLRARIRNGEDPLGDAFSQIWSSANRRHTGSVYTPARIVRSIIHWASAQGTPARVVDPGCGSGRFILAAAKQFPRARLVAVDTDPRALLMLRANAAVLGCADRLDVVCEDYRAMTLPLIGDRTLFIGNPPYVRHHDISERWKSWFAETAASYGIKASKLAGLHIHFFLKTRELGSPGDYGAFITSAEWMDVNYGAVLRKLLSDGLGGTALHVLTPELAPFADAATTGAITCFKIGQRPRRIRIRTVKSLDELSSLTSGRAVPWAVLQNVSRWSGAIRPNAKAPAGFIELGELCRVHRGQVTGGNDTWIAGSFPGPIPKRFLVPTITKARELFAAAPVLSSPDGLRRVINLPISLDELAPEERKQIEAFLGWAKARGAHESYIAATRRAWWSVCLRPPAPILCTYMARRPPAFVRNACEARHLNIAHGLYPRSPMSESDLMALVVYLSNNVRLESGRTYAGGLTKFEPKELERIAVPQLENIREIAASMDFTGAAGRRRKSQGEVQA